MLNISKQLLSVKIISQVQLDNFVFNNDKWTWRQLRWLIEIPKYWLDKALIIAETKTKAKQQLLAKDLFCPQIKRFKRKRIAPLFKDDNWSADLIDEPSLSKRIKNYKLIWTVIDLFAKYAWAIPFINLVNL